MRVLVTGNAGFIGYHVAVQLLRRGDSVVGADIVNDYYSPVIKESRLGLLEQCALQSSGEYRFHRVSLADPAGVKACFSDGPFDRVIHLAAQAGVRYSLENPGAYVESNIIAFTNILEACRYSNVKHLTYASTSSVYGANTNMPFSERQGVDHPLQFYAATKRANELMAHSYAHLFRLPATGLRFFTVYGPWGRPDMSPMLFAKAILAGEPIRVFNHGKMRRDYTYIDDIVEGVVRTLERPPATGADGEAPHAVYNIGNHEAVELETFITTLEQLLGRKAIRDYQPMQAGDVPATYASIDRLRAATGFAPRTPLAEGLARFVDWYRGYYPT
jgi:UDP-glucuronate 4-epimerase